MRFFSWNVNGLRSALAKGFADFFAAEEPDVICLQEVRALPEQVDFSPAGYHAYWHPAERKGYSGVAVFTRTEPEAVHFGMGPDDPDPEGRVLTLEYGKFHVVTVYTPNSQRGLARLEFRQRWDADFLAYLRDLEARKPVVVCGDFNVSHKPIDLANPKANEGNAGYTPEERAGFDALVEAGFIDTFREFESGGGHYTWWTYRVNARERNIGWRLDYFLISRSLRPALDRAWILSEVTGSDHCPVAIDLHPI